MTIKIGDRIPSTILKCLTEDGLQDVRTEELFEGKTVLFGVPGAFTPTCSAKHLPGYIIKTDEFRAKGVRAIMCLSVNDPFVMQAWAKSAQADDKITMLADGNGTLTKALGLEMDGTPYGLGIRCQRFALVAQDGVVTQLAIEQPGGFEVSGAEAVLKLVG